MRAHLKSAVAIAALVLGFCATSFLARPAAQSANAKGKAETYYYFVYSNPTAGQEAQFNKWYNEQHQLDVVAVPGFMTAQRFVFNDLPLYADAQAKLPKYLVVYKVVTSDLDGVFKEVSRRLQSGETKIDPSFDRATSVGFTYRQLEPWHMKSKPDQPPNVKPGKADTYWHIVFTPFNEGKEDVFNQIYTANHIPELVARPGFTGGVRLILAQPDNRTDALKATKYAAIFTVETSDLAAVKNLQAPRGTANPGQDGTNTRGYTYRAITQEVSGDTVRADRAKRK